MDRLVALDRLPRAEAAAMVEEVVDLDRRIFRYTSPAAGERYFEEFRDLSKPHCYACLYREGGVAIGYFYIKIEPWQVRGRRVHVINASTGLLPGYTGRNRTAQGVIEMGFRYKLRNPSHDTWFVGFLTSPVSYNLVASVCSRVYPRVSGHDPDGFEHALIHEAGSRWGLENRSDHPAYYIASIATLAEPVRLRRSTPHTRFFESINPHHAQGDFLGVCLPIDLRTLAEATLRRLVRT